eukprot:scaffold158273_cov17-Tisochrysis_lutea.AAC.1
MKWYAHNIVGHKHASKNCVGIRAYMQAGAAVVCWWGANIQAKVAMDGAQICRQGLPWYKGMHASRGCLGVRANMQAGVALVLGQTCKQGLPWYKGGAQTCKHERALGRRACSHAHATFGGTCQSVENEGQFFTGPQKCWVAFASSPDHWHPLNANGLKGGTCVQGNQCHECACVG